VALQDSQSALHISLFLNLFFPWYFISTHKKNTTTSLHNTQHTTNTGK